ncbi:MAG TPA: rod shape-determining protein MreC [Acidimicrobiia bacterium]|jgi:rod shape-determining protein MreC
MIDREPHRDRSLPTFITLVVAAFLLMTFDIRVAGGDVASGIRSGALQLLAPLQRVAAVVVDPIADLAESLAGLASLRAENSALKAEVARLQAEVASTQNLQARLEVLEQVNDLEILSPDIPRTLANVFGRPDTLGSSFIIDKGSDHGIAVGHPVLDPFGYVVGKVVEVAPGYATVVPITQDREAVTVLVDGQVGILTSHVGSEVLTLEVFDAIEPLQAGDLVVTSAVSVSFPQGLPVGEVTEDVDLEGTALSADVQPFADPDDLQVVVVITWPPEPGPSTATTATTLAGTVTTTTGGQSTTTTGG